MSLNLIDITLSSISFNVLLLARVLDFPTPLLLCLFLNKQRLMEMLKWSKNVNLSGFLCLLITSRSLDQKLRIYDMGTRLGGDPFRGHPPGADDRRSPLRGRGKLAFHRSPGGDLSWIPPKGG
jgi:hypothetical protein